MFLTLAAVSGRAFLNAQEPTPTAAVQQTLMNNKAGLADIRKEIDEEKRKERLDELQEKHVLNRIHKVDITLNKLRKAKETNQAVLQQTQAKSSELQEEVAEKQAQMEENHQMLAQRLLELYRASFHQSPLGGLLDTDSLADLTRRLKFDIMLAQSNEQLLNKILADEDRLRKDSTQWAMVANHKQKIIQILDRKEKNYDQEKINHTASLEDIRKEKEQQEETIRQLTESAKDLQDKVSQMLKEAARESKIKKRKKTIVVNSTSTTTTVEPENPVEEGEGLQVVRGRIPWPVSGRIISYFGKTRDPRFNLVVDNSGIQIEAPSGTPIHAVAAGVVKFADWFKGYGKLVILDHGRGYYSLYAQASNLNVLEGQSVASGQVLGSVGDTDSLVGSSLYFEIRKNGTPQDPLHWLKYRN